MGPFFSFFFTPSDPEDRPIIIAALALGCPGTLTPTGYAFRLLFFWLPSADMAVERVQERVMEGSHHVWEEVIRRRYDAGLKNFFRIYRPLAASWQFYDNSMRGGRRLIASGGLHQTTVVFEPDLWNNVNREWR